MRDKEEERFELDLLQYKVITLFELKIMHNATKYQFDS